MKVTFFLIKIWTQLNSEVNKLNLDSTILALITLTQTSKRSQLTNNNHHKKINIMIQTDIKTHRRK